jgi:integrase
MKAYPTLRSLVRQYLTHRRAMGYLLLHYDGHLHNFAKFSERVAPGQPVTTALAVKWATSVNASRPHQAKRLSLIRSFARFCAACDPRTQVPPINLLGPRGDRIAPHIFSRPQVRSLMLRARALGTRLSPLRAHTYEAFIGLLASTGLRPGEARRLRLVDFDAGAQTLRIPSVKTSPERILPLHPTTVRALARYIAERQQVCPFGDHLFVGPRGQPLAAPSLPGVFRQIVEEMPSNGARRHPRLQDLRHTFATRHIATWERTAAPLAHRLLLLSRYLGHRSFHDTWWYVSTDPTALRQAADKFDRFRHGRRTFER